ncbi:MAG: hypothetical protein M3388_06190, partial [Acidobacteriota bacterium]|nr:hypothetical protein [Acidobacteriota bacterium]
ASAEMLTKTAKAIAENKPAEVLNVVDDLIGRGQDLRNFCRDLLSFFRDLLIFKMAGEAENLLDTAVLSRDELRESSAPFSESDLIRFFNSLSETESKLREATQPRYVLEIGLVKLVEMRRVVSIEKLLERLAKLEAAFGAVQTQNSIQEISSEKLAEKKTLTIDFSLEEVPFPVSNNSNLVVKEESSVEKAENSVEIVETISDPFEEVLFQESIQEPISVFEKSPINSPNRIDSTPTFAESFANNLESLPMKLPPILSEELEHVEDAWLDDAFERKLQQLGDDLSPIKNVSEIVGLLLGGNQPNSFAAKIEISNGGAATAFAPAKVKPSFVIPEFDEEESTEIPVLPENPTEEEMWQYAQNHPLVKKVLRVFRGKIVEVSKTQDSEFNIQN